jgi:hypothetical protein
MARPGPKMVFSVFPISRRIEYFVGPMTGVNIMKISRLSVTVPVDSSTVRINAEFLV